jgi:hypothetical protein
LESRDRHRERGIARRDRARIAQAEITAADTLPQHTGRTGRARYETPLSSCSQCGVMFLNPAQFDANSTAAPNVEAPPGCFYADAAHG